MKAATGFVTSGTRAPGDVVLTHIAGVWGQALERPDRAVWDGLGACCVTLLRGWRRRSRITASPPFGPLGEE